MVVRDALCAVTRTYAWQLLEHHFASLRLDINSAPQLPQVTNRIAAEHILMLLNSADAITPGARAFFGCKSKARNTRCWLADWRVLNSIFRGIADIG